MQRIVIIFGQRVMQCSYRKKSSIVGEPISAARRASPLFLIWICSDSCAATSGPPSWSVCWWGSHPAAPGPAAPIDTGMGKVITPRRAIQTILIDKRHFTRPFTFHGPPPTAARRTIHSAPADKRLTLIILIGVLRAGKALGAPGGDPAPAGPPASPPALWPSAAHTPDPAQRSPQRAVFAYRYPLVEPPSAADPPTTTSASLTAGVSLFAPACCALACCQALNRAMAWAEILN